MVIVPKPNQPWIISPYMTKKFQSLSLWERLYVVSEVIGKLHIQSLSNEEMLGTSGWTNPNPLSQHWFNINEAKSLIIHLAEKVVILTQTFKPVFALL